MAAKFSEGFTFASCDLNQCANWVNSCCLLIDYESITFGEVVGEGDANFILVKYEFVDWGGFGSEQSGHLEVVCFTPKL